MPRQGTSSDRVKPCIGFEPSEEVKTTHIVNLYSQEKPRLQVLIPKPLCNIMQTMELTRREGAGLSWPQITSQHNLQADKPSEPNAKEYGFTYFEVTNAWRRIDHMTVQIFNQAWVVSYVNAAYH